MRSDLIIHQGEDERKLFDDAADLGLFLWGDPGQDEGQMVGVRLLVPLNDQLLDPRRAAGPCSKPMALPSRAAPPRRPTSSRSDSMGWLLPSGESHQTNPDAGRAHQDMSVSG